MSRSVYVVRDATLLTGWLFADLLLGLMVVFLASSPGAPPPPPPPTPTPTLTPVPTNTATPTQSPTPVPITVLSDTPKVFFIQTNADILLGRRGDINAERDRLRTEIVNMMSTQLAGQRAGIALTFGSTNRAGEGTLLAREVNDLLKQSLPDVFNQQSVMEDFIDLTGKYPRGMVEIRVFVFVEAR